MGTRQTGCCCRLCAPGHALLHFRFRLRCHPQRAGYALGAAAGFECGAARGAAATLAALAPRLPADLAGRVQEAQQQQQAQQQIAAMPFQQLQRQVCESLMAATEPAAGQQQGPALPPGVRTGLSDACAAVERLGLQAPEPRHQ